MRIQILSVGRNMPSWIEEGAREYIRRMPPELPVSLKEVMPANRKKSMPQQKIIDEESEKLVNIMARGYSILADTQGQHWSTEDLAARLGRWMQAGEDVTIVIGGPDGVNDKVRKAANETWSLSKLTFPHPLVRVIIAEQLYRACSILKNHPYHRA